MTSPEGLRVRLSAAAPEADLEAVVQPGLSAVYLPCCESPEDVRRVDEIVTRLERLRGIRPGTVAVQPLVETPEGVANARALASASGRVRAFGAGPKLYLRLGAESPAEEGALAYARAECELAARALDLEPIDLEYVGD